MNKLQLFSIMMVTSCGGAVEYAEDYYNLKLPPCADSGSPDSGMMVIGNPQQASGDGGNIEASTDTQLDVNSDVPRKCANEDQVWCDNFQTCFDSVHPYFCVSLNKEDAGAFITPEPRWFTVLDALESCPTSNTEIRRVCSSEETANGYCNSCGTILFSVSDLHIGSTNNVTSASLCPYGVLGYCMPEPADVPLGTHLYSVVRDDFNQFNSLDNICKNNGFKFVVTCEQVSQWRVDYL
jgi:hypothetical protein